MTDPIRPDEVQPPVSRLPAVRGLAPVVEEMLMAVPNFLKLGWRLVPDPRVPTNRNLFAAVSLAYGLTPIDLIPDFVPILGQMDDALIIALGLHQLLEAAGPEVVNEHWDGGGDALEMIEAVFEWGASLIPASVRHGVGRMLG